MQSLYDDRLQAEQYECGGLDVKRRCSASVEAISAEEGCRGLQIFEYWLSIWRMKLKHSKRRVQ